MRYVIQTPTGFVRGINEEHQCVTVVPSADKAKKFKNHEAACDFVDTYADCGYGLSSGDATSLVRIS